MKKKHFQINGIPSILLGNPSSKLYIYIHGQCGYKEEAEAFANIAVRHGWQVLSIDLPEHGERKEEKNSFDPWHVVPELVSIMEYAKCHWNQISLYANSIGAWFSMLSFEKENLKECIFVSPILDMQQLISNMMLWANVSEEQLKHELIIPTSFGHTLSWEYLQYVKQHPITQWNVPTNILYGKYDELTEISVVERFVEKFNCNLAIMENGKHWFNTPEELNTLYKWLNTLVK
ncbi:alpha/beta hydrolase [Clostridioides sp. ZZV15-6383]|uniref:alpha/beta hydrolase n=1 Tax=unclassified Clostridioides TaxID=2635829 RepID=UPI001D1169A6|nr:alpha/beta hydrolase [Clostridioides sp. ZZV14-6345]MCC0698206.1 alpha/beta hydrolase [Clostridioides sp. ZZV15-6383]